jgi:hypothetical protein
MLRCLSVLILIVFLLIGCVQTRTTPTGKLSLSFQKYTGSLEVTKPAQPLKKELLQPVASESSKINVELIVAASASMFEKDEKGKIKIQEAKKEVLKTIEGISTRFKNATFGLRVYGSQPNRKVSPCEDAELIVPIGTTDEATLREKVQLIVSPGGMAPLAFSVMKARENLEKLEGRKMIIVFTDGKETCGGSLCQVVSQVMASGIEKPLIHLIGSLPDDKTRAQLECVANLPAISPTVAKQIEESRTRKKIAQHASFGSYVYTLYSGKNQIVARQSIREGTIMLHNLSPGRYQLQIETQPENLPGFPITKDVFVQGNRILAVKVTGNQIFSQ